MSIELDSIWTSTPLPHEAVLPAAFPVVRGADHRRAQESGHAEGHTAGYAAGLRLAEREAAEARRRMEAEHQDLLQRLAADAEQSLSRQAAVLAASAQALDRRAAPVLAESERVMAECAVALAQEVLGAVLGNTGVRVRAALTRVFGDPQQPLPVRVRLHPDDLAALNMLRIERAGDLAALDGVLEPACFIADEALTPGDAMAEYPYGFLDARLEAALDRARAALLDVATDPELLTNGRP